MPGVGGAGATLDSAVSAAELRLPRSLPAGGFVALFLGRPFEDTVFVCEIPEPGMPTVRVTLPRLFAEMRAPLVPPLRPTLLGVTVIRTPGANLNDLRTLNPMVPLGSTLSGQSYALVRHPPYRMP